MPNPVGRPLGAKSGQRRGAVKLAKAYAARLYQARVDRKLTQAELARLASVSQCQVGRWENAGGLPSLDASEAMAKALGVCPGWLSHGVEVKS